MNLGSWAIIGWGRDCSSAYVPHNSTVPGCSPGNGAGIGHCSFGAVEATSCSGVSGWSARVYPSALPTNTTSPTPSLTGAETIGGTIHADPSRTTWNPAP